MRSRRLALAFGLLFGVSAYADPKDHAPIRPCTEKQLLGHVPDSDEVEAHRAFSLPVISYPFGTKLDFDWAWGITLTMRIDESGRVVCYEKKDRRNKDLVLNAERQAVIDSLGTWNYRPFLVNGQVAAAIVTEYVYEQEVPQRHTLLPEAPLQDVSISLSRDGCFGSCPSYQVTLDGTGHATYRGSGFVDIMGAHSYPIPPDRVARLVESLRAKDIWSLRPEYRAQISDSVTNLLEMKIGNQHHTLEDYVGLAVGMPKAVAEFEEEVDTASGSDMWVHLSQEAVDHLKAENFDFRSAEGAALLARAVSNEGTRDDEAIVALIRLGAPLSGANSSHGPFEGPTGSLLEMALRNRRTAVVAELIARGALETRGKPDQIKIDAAFRAAIMGGRLALVQEIWDLSGERHRPSLTFRSRSSDEKSVTKRSPVTLLLKHEPYEHDAWDGLAIAKWLIQKGCNLKSADADGTTLLHIAAQAGDPTFVKYLLDAGFDPSTPGQFRLPALAGTEQEDVALMLLKAGTDPAHMDDGGRQFRRYAVSSHWQQVIDWLSAHGN